MEEVFEAYVIIKYDKSCFVVIDQLLKKIKDSLPEGIDINYLHGTKITITFDTRKK